MTNQILKYNTYRNILPGKGRQFVLQGRGIVIHTPDDAIMALLTRVSIVLIITLLGVYIAEKSSMVFSQRAVFTQEQKAVVAEKEVSSLEITTTQLAAAHNLTQVASAEHMIIPQKVSYLNMDGGAVALVDQSFARE